MRNAFIALILLALIPFAPAGTALAADTESATATPPVPTTAPAVKPTYLSMDFTDVELPVLIKFMSEQTKRNFIFDERVTGKITIVSPRRVTLEEAYNVFLSVLQVKGYTVVELGNTLKIVPLGTVRQENLPTSGDNQTRGASEFVSRLIPLQNVESAEIVGILSPLVSKDGLLSPFPATNTLLLIDSSSNIDRILRIIAEIDIPSAGASLRLFPLKNASASEVAKLIEQLYADVAPVATPAAATPTGRGGKAARSVTTAAGTRAKAVGIKVIPDVRTNTLIVQASVDLLTDIETLIKKIDVAAPENTGKINVVYLENADAEEVAKVLASLSERKTTTAAATAPGAAPAVVAKGAITAELEGGVKIAADKATNSLIVIASANDFQTLLEVVKKLDIRRRQVYVEALIMEISLEKGRDVGSEFRGAIDTGNGAAIVGSNFDFSGNVNDLFSAISSGNPLLFSGTGMIAGGIAGNVNLPDGTSIPAVTAVLRAAQSLENVNILSSPHLLTLDNKEAEIIVGENVPFITSQSRDATNLSNTTNTIERKDVGVTLRITPHIHESNFVSLDIYQESSSVKSTSILDASKVGPTTTKRSAKTSVLVSNGDTVVLGGMMQEQVGNIERKVPFLGDIPILGWLFKYNSVSRKKTNMLIFLTPRIITDPKQMNGIAAEQRKKMDVFVEKNKEDVEKVIPENGSGSKKQSPDALPAPSK